MRFIISNEYDIYYVTEGRAQWYLLKNMKPMKL